MLDWLNRRWPGLRHDLLRPFVVDVNPDWITVAALLVAVVAGVALWQRMFLPAALLILLNGFMDILDGEVAAKRRTSRRGDLLDHTADRLADIAMLGGAMASGLVDMWLGAAAMVLVLLVSYIGTEAQALTRKRLYAGLLGRADRLVLMAAGSILQVFWYGSLSIVILVIVVLSAVTFCQRFAMLWSTLR